MGRDQTGKILLNEFIDYMERLETSECKTWGMRTIHQFFNWKEEKAMEICEKTKKAGENPFAEKFNKEFFGVKEASPLHAEHGDTCQRLDEWIPLLLIRGTVDALYTDKHGVWGSPQDRTEYMRNEFLPKHFYSRAEK